MSYKFVNKNWKQKLIASRCSNFELDTNMVSIDIKAFDSANIEEYPNPVDILQEYVLGYDYDQDAWVVHDIQVVIDFFSDWEDFNTNADIEFRAENKINCNYRRWYNHNYEQLYITDDVEDAIAVADMVVPSNTTILKYNDDFFIDIEYRDREWNAYIYRHDYGVKMHMFGQEVFANGIDSIDDFMVMVVNNAEDYIPIYDEDIEILEDGTARKLEEEHKCEEN